MQYRNYKIDLRLKDKITVLTGESASGKSTLHKVLRSPADARLIVVSDNRFNIMFLDSDQTLRLVTRSGLFDEYNIYIIDENTIDFDDNLAIMMQKSPDTYFIVITRTELRNLNYSITALKQLVTEKDGISRLHNHMGIAKRTRYELEYNRPSICIIEDKGKAFEWFKSLFERSGIEMDLTCGGKEQVCDTAIEYLSKTNGYILLIFDECSFGSCYKKLENIIEKFGNRLFILSNYKSWEYLILRSNFYRSQMRQYDIDSEVFEEKFYEIQLDKLSSQVGNFTRISHNKIGSKLSKCYTNSCCAYKGKTGRHCSIGLSGNDKFISMLIGTEYEDILILAKRMEI